MAIFPLIYINLYEIALEKDNIALTVPFLVPMLILKLVPNED